MSDIDLRWSCLQLAAVTLKKPADHSVVIDAAAAFYEFTVATNQGAARHDAANVHNAHPTIQ